MCVILRIAKFKNVMTKLLFIIFTIVCKDVSMGATLLPRPSATTTSNHTAPTASATESPHQEEQKNSSSLWTGMCPHRARRSPHHVRGEAYYVGSAITQLQEGFTMRSPTPDQHGDCGSHHDLSGWKKTGFIVKEAIKSVVLGPAKKISETQRKKSKALRMKSKNLVTEQMRSQVS